jgi:hypothetical protein
MQFAMIYLWIVDSLNVVPSGPSMVKNASALNHKILIEGTCSHRNASKTGKYGETYKLSKC